MMERVFMRSSRRLPENRRYRYTAMIRTHLAHAVLPSLVALHVAAQLANPAFAGTTTGTVAGITRTTDGSRLSQAAVVAHNLVDSSADRFTISNADGTYELPDLAPGEYELRAWKRGYRSAPAERILVAAAARAAFDPALGVDGAADTAVNTAAQPTPAFADAREVEALKQRIEQLEAQLQVLSTQHKPAQPVVASAAVPAEAVPQVSTPPSQAP